MTFAIVAHNHAVVSSTSMLVVVMVMMMTVVITLDQLTDLLPVLGHYELQCICVIIERDPEVPIFSFKCLQLLTLPLDRQDEVGSWDLRVHTTQLTHLLVVLCIRVCVWRVFMCFGEKRSKKTWLAMNVNIRRR